MMIKYSHIIIAACVIMTEGAFAVSAASDRETTMTVWADRPATIWEETFPQGDGRLAIAADGGVTKEKIVLNDITLWSGSVFDYTNPESVTYLPEIRRLLLENKNGEAQKIMNDHFSPKLNAKGDPFGCYQILADLNIDYDYAGPTPTPSAYRRTLHLDSGESVTEFSLPDGTRYTRLYSVPREQEAIIVMLTASKPGMINFSYNLSRPERSRRSSSGDALLLTGELDSGQEGIEGMRYALASRVRTIGKSARAQIEGDSIMRICDADTAWIIVGAATSFLYDDCPAAALEMVNKAISDPEATITTGNGRFRELMSRAELTLPANQNSLLPTAERINLFQDDDSDAALAALYYNFGRYLSVSSTRPDLLPPNLQGIWANQINTPWKGDYHTNINVQMNHWHLEEANLSELHNPLKDLVANAIPSGMMTAKSFYGDDARGWIMHFRTNVWGFTGPGKNPLWGSTVTGGAWLCSHLWQHYLFNGDNQYLAEIYPIMKGSADFFLSTMIEEPEHGWLVTAPSSSPENMFYESADSRYPVGVCMAPAMDTQIIYELWSNLIAAGKILGHDEAYSDTLRQAVAKLPPMQIDSEGRLMEWLREYIETDRQHRHVSHLYGLYPGNSISYYSTPDLIEAARKTLEVRGDGGTGWSRAWKMNFYSRLHDGDGVWRVFKGLLQPAVTDESAEHRAGTYPNLFCAHPPFQIDGNFGATAALGEMLMQSHEGYVELFPAIPSNLKEGSFRGFKAQGGSEWSVRWSNGKISDISVKGGFQPVVRVKLPAGLDSLADTRGNTYTKDKNGLIEIALARGEEIYLTPGF